MLIETKNTPNPATLKFLPGRGVSPKRNWELASATAAARVSPLAVELFKIDGVEGIMLGGNFISVTKGTRHSWEVVRPTVLQALMQHYIKGTPMFVANPTELASAQTGRSYSPEAQQIVDQIQELLETRVRPVVVADGGDITFHDFDYDTGELKLNMQGACAGCPSATATLQNGVERLMQHYVPEVFKVTPV